MSTTDNSMLCAESIAGNEDLLTEVLSHLPVRPLIRFKSVSKQWLNLISDRRFSHLHSRLHRKPTCSALLFFHNSLSSPVSFPRSFDFIPLRGDGNRSSPPPFFSDLESSYLKILQSCNGLLLLGSLVPTVFDADFSYFVCNPTTNQISRLPVPNEIEDGNLSVAGVNLGFDPEKREGYKVICVWRSNSDENQHGIDVYSPGTGQWRRAIDCNTEALPFDLEFERGVYCDRKIHWLSHTENSVFFDLESERIRLLPLPPPIEGVYIERFRYLGESMGHLHLIEIRTNSLSEFDVLELNKETLIWSVKYRVNLDVVGSQFEDDMFQNFNDRFGRRLRFYAFSILAVVRAEDEDDMNLVLSIPGKVIIHNIKTGFTDLLLEVGDQSDRWLPLKGHNAFQFIESLYCI